MDTETIPTKQDNGRTTQVFRLGVAVFLRIRKDVKNNTREVLYFTDINDFWEKVVSFVKGKNTLHIIAHNALFDLTVMQFQTKLTYLGFECKFLFEQGFTFISKWQNGGVRLMILDNTNWFAGKLDKWGDKLGFDKLPMPNFNASNELWYTYCLRDTEILEKLQLWLIEFITVNNLGNWKFTLASLSFNSYRHRFMDYPIYIPENTRETYLARNAYKGGRTECFYSGKATDGPFYKLDINSMYPYVMMVNDFPTNVEGYISKPKLWQVRRLLDKYALCGLFRVRLSIPWLPHKVNNKTCYPIGEFTAFLSTPEIRVLLDNQEIVECLELAVYRRRPIFKSFVEYFYKERMKWKHAGDELRSYMFKIFQNSLYGKFGQRGFNDKIIGQAPMGTYETSFYYDRISGAKGYVRQIGVNVIRSEKQGEAYNAFVAVASHVTAYARIYLYTLIRLANRTNVYYTDTDSIITNNTGLANLRNYLDNDKIGLLKVEGQSEQIEIVSPKHYGFGKEWKIKGISKSATKLGKGRYQQEIWPRLNTLIKEDKEHYFNYTIVKQLSAKVSSGVVGLDGFVTPFVVNE